MARAFIGLGSNLGDRAKTLTEAVAALEGAGVRVVAGSSIYETDPVGGPSQPRFLNQVIEIDFEGTPRRLLETCQRIELLLGRNRAREERWGPREIDLDVLAVGDAIAKEPGLDLPHPRIAERAFVLVPWAEIAPEFEVAGRGRVRDLLAALGAVRGVRRV